jgi:hypothetical protein
MSAVQHKANGRSMSAPTGHDAVAALDARFRQGER